MTLQGGRKNTPKPSGWPDPNEEIHRAVIRIRDLIENTEVQILRL